MKRAFVIDPMDNVGTVVAEGIVRGDRVEVGDRTIPATDDVPYGHKIALSDIVKGAQVLKYGLSIGTATRDIKTGEHVHVHNVESNRGRGDRVVTDSRGASS